MSWLFVLNLAIQPVAIFPCSAIQQSNVEYNFPDVQLWHRPASKLAGIHSTIRAEVSPTRKIAKDESMALLCFAYRKESERIPYNSPKGKARQEDMKICQVELSSKATRKRNKKRM